MAKATAKKRYAFTHDLVKEVISGVLKGGDNPSKALRKALSASSGKTEIEIYQMVVDIHSQNVGYEEDPYVPVGPTVSNPFMP